MIELFEHDLFPCPYCPKPMGLVGIWNSDYGWIYHYIEDTEDVKK
ncbi:hypothetical protein ACFQ3N_16605 [Virgibacillus byunsanensis]|uniref:Uncharacterized protein n=1 Tax=Virgibacillus byunsanensis TaxID=570945 RepID=A0ABW3LPW5_9BACI